MNDDGTVVTVYDVVHSEFCVSSEDGQKLFDLIVPSLEQGQQITISFARVESLSSAFLNAAFGQLLSRFDSEILRNQLQVRDLPPGDEVLLHRVIESAKRYFQDSATVDNARRQVLETV